MRFVYLIYLTTNYRDGTCEPCGSVVVVTDEEKASKLCREANKIVGSYAKALGNLSPDDVSAFEDKHREVLANRFSRLFGIPAAVHPSDIDSSTLFFVERLRMVE